MENFPQLNKVTLSSRNEGMILDKFADILETQFVTLIVGKPGSGKSTLIEQLVLNPDLYHKKFDYVLIVSPSTFMKLQPESENTCH